VVWINTYEVAETNSRAIKFAKNRRPCLSSLQDFLDLNMVRLLGATDHHAMVYSQANGTSDDATLQRNAIQIKENHGI
jgi:hypothetical protein